MGEEKSLSGRVIAVGPGRYLESGHFLKTTIQEGDIVFFPKFGSQRTSIDGEEYIICAETELLAKIN
jgi:chaperonin GroES